LSQEESKIGPLPPGKYRVHALTADGRKAEKSVTLNGEAESKVKLRVN
jgi:hypothetical protein